MEENKKLMQMEQKDFSEIIELAKTCQPPVEVESGEITDWF